MKEKLFTREKMGLIVSELEQLRESRGWSEVILANKLGIDYSYLYRVLRYKRNIGAAFIIGLLRLCEKEKLDIYKILYL